MVDSHPDYRTIFSSPGQDLLEESAEMKAILPSLRRLMGETAEIEFDWDSPEDLARLREDQLLALRDAALGPANDALREELTPLARRVIQSVFGDNAEYPIRVSAQIKKPWTPADLERDERGDSHYANFAYPTRAHQDLVNNGCRSSHTLILYYQLTAPTAEANNMEVADMGGGPVGLLATTDEYGYANELTPTEQARLSWYTPDYTPGNIYYLSGLKAHRTGEVSTIPRIALNIKVQPSDLQYLNQVYGVDLALVQEADSLDKRYRTLIEILRELVSVNNGLHFELGVLHGLLGDEKAAVECIERLFVSERPTHEEAKRLLYGGFLRKVISSSDAFDYDSVELGEASVVELSCAHAVMNTVGAR
jgi:hypothetical protein